MLRDEDLKRKKSWENWEGFRNLVFMTGLINYANKLDKSFKLQQLGSENSQVTVKFKKSDYYPKDFVNEVPVKIIGRMRQNPDLAYPSLITYPLKIARMSDADVLLDATLSNPDNQNQHFVNRVQLAGFVYDKKIIGNNTMMLLLWNGQNRLIPVCIVGEHHVTNAVKTRQFKPVRVDGKLGFKTLDGKPQVCVVAQKFRSAVRGDDIPKTDPEWFKEAVTKFFNNQTIVVAGKEKSALIDGSAGKQNNY